MNDFNKQECKPFIDPLDVNAYFSFMTSDNEPTTFYLDNSWGCTGINIGPLIKNGETITHLFLTPEQEPTALQYNREDYGRELVPNSGIDCIPGNQLSRIVSTQLLKDVNQTTNPIKGGGVYMFNADSNMFEPYDLQTFVNNTNATLADHTARINRLEQDLAALVEHVDQLEIFFRRWLNSIEDRIAPPAGCPSNARIMHGNINTYSDYTNSGSRQWGHFSHSLSTTIPNDMQFS